MFFVRLLSERRFCCCESRMFCWADRATHLQKYRKLSLPPLLLAFSWVLDLKFASEWYPQHHLGCIVKLSCDRHQDHQYEWQQIFWKWQINKKKPSLIRSTKSSHDCERLLRNYCCNRFRGAPNTFSSLLKSAFLLLPSCECCELAVSYLS